MGKKKKTKKTCFMKQTWTEVRKYQLLVFRASQKKKKLLNFYCFGSLNEVRKQALGERMKHKAGALLHTADKLA